MVKNDQQLCYNFVDLVVELKPFCESMKLFHPTGYMPIYQYGVVGDPATGLTISYNASDVSTGEQSTGIFSVSWAQPTRRGLSTYQKTDESLSH